MTNARNGRTIYLVDSGGGLLDDTQWKIHLSGYSTELLEKIRKRLKNTVRGLCEKFNRDSRYFGFRKGKDADRVYIYVQKKGLRIDLCIDRKYENELRRAGFIVDYVNNYQGQAGWLTGWKMPNSCTDIRTVIYWIEKAFRES